jgi:soluble lytic murein transglycosylase
MALFTACKRLAARYLAGLILPAMLASLPAGAADDGAMPVQQPREAAIEVQATSALPPYSDAWLRGEAEPDPETIKAAVAAYRRGALGEGDALAQGIDNRAARALLEWVAIRSGANLIPFSRLNAFLQAHPNYPATSPFRRRAEEALISEKKSPAVIRAFFHAQRPASPAGRLALALALKAEGQTDEANALIRQVWRQDHLGQPLEKLALAAFGDGLFAPNAISSARMRAPRCAMPRASRPITSCSPRRGSPAPRPGGRSRPR